VQDEEFAEAGGGSRLTFYLDGAHTPESMAAAANWFADAAVADGFAGAGAAPSSRQQQQQPAAAGGPPGPPRPPAWGGGPHDSSSGAPFSASSGDGGIPGGASGGGAYNVLMFNCMKERDPAALLPALAGSLRARGLGVAGALFVPPDSQYAFLASAKSAGKVAELNADVAWQAGLRDVWERCGAGGGGSGGEGGLRLALPALPGAHGGEGSGLGGLPGPAA
jgi:folylpolyglutamate synthase